MNFIFGFSDLILRTSAMPNNLPIQPTKSSPIYSSNNRSQSRLLDSLNPNPIDNKPISKLELQCETELERMLLVLIMQDSMHNPYMFKVVIPLSHIPGAPSFIGINVTDFLERFEDMVIDYGLFDDRKI